MKKIIIILSLGILILAGCSNESPVVRKAFSKYKHKDGVETVSFPGFLIRWFVPAENLDKSENQLLRSIDKVSVINVEDAGLSSKINLSREFLPLLKADRHYEELFSSHDRNNDVSIFGKMEGTEVIKELIIISGGSENAIVYLKGNFDSSLLDGKIDLSNPGRFLKMVKQGN